MNVLSTIAAAAGGKPEATSLSTALIAGAAVVLGGLLTALASFYAARRKLTELKLVYEQQLADRYLENARQYLQAIYVPLSIALNTLRRSYSTLPPTDGPTFMTGATMLVSDFINVAETLVERGADAFMITELDERLQDFLDFLRRSLIATSDDVRYVLTVHSLGVVSNVETRSSLMAAVANGMRVVQRYGFSPLGISMEARKRTVAAPLDSPVFGDKIISDVALLKALIKQVTLGSSGHV